MFADRLDQAGRATLLNLVYYPRETRQRISSTFADAPARAEFVRDTIVRELELVRVLMARYSLRHARRVCPTALAGVFSELLFSPLLARDPAYVDALLAPFIRDDGGVEILRSTAHILRSLSSYEVIVAGDLGDRGPRIDRVLDALRRQRRVSITWGNHDAEWMGACLGRIAQLEEGYGIPVEPLEQLVHSAYANDPAERFHSKGEDLRDPLLLARMQKAAAVLQFKLEGQTSRRNPHYDLESRCLLHRIDPVAGTVTIDGNVHPLLDRSFPTIDWTDPYELSEAEQRCIDRLRRSFLASASLWRDRGSMPRARGSSGRPPRRRIEVWTRYARTTSSGRAARHRARSCVRRLSSEAGNRAEAPEAALRGSDRFRA